MEAGMLRVVWEEAGADKCRQALASHELFERLGHMLFLLSRSCLPPGVERGRGEREREEILLQLLPFDGLEREDDGIVVRWYGASEWSGERSPVRLLSRSAALLDEVLLESLTEKSFLHSQEEEEEFRWHIAMGDMGRVVGEGDCIRLPSGQRYRVLHCSPFRQGLIPPIRVDGSSVESATARVVVLPPSQSSVMVESDESHSLTTEVEQDGAVGGAGFHSLLFPQTVPVGEAWHTSEQVDGIEVEIIPLSVPVTKRRVHEESDRDANRRALASFDLMQALCISSGAWVRVRVGERERFLRLFPFGKSNHSKRDLQGSRVIAISPDALFALQIEDTVERKGRASGRVRVALVEENREGVAGELPCGRAAKLSMTRIASYDAYGHVSANDIAEYFKTPRIVREGDVLLIPSKKLSFVEEARFKQGQQSSEGGGDDIQALYDELVKAESILSDEDDEDRVGRRPVFYKVTSVSTEGERHIGLEALANVGYVSAERTELTENGGYVHSRVPRGCIEFERGCAPLAPAGLESSFESLRDSLAPLVGRGCARALKNDIVCSFLIHGSHGSGKGLLVERVASSLGLHLMTVDCFDIVDAVDGRTVAALEDVFDDAFAIRPGILLLRNVGVLERAASQQQRESLMAGAFRSAVTRLTEKVRGEESESTDSLPNTVTIIATVTKVDDLSANLRSCFSHEIHVESPDEVQRFSMMKAFLEPGVGAGSGVGGSIYARSIAVQTAGCTGGDLEALTALSKAHSLANKREVAVSDRGMGEEVFQSLGASLTSEDLSLAFERIHTAQAEELGAPKVPNVRWDDVGGLAEAKKDIVDTIQLPLSHPHLFADGLRLRSGVLLYGPPGTGKTLLAKAVATECSLNFLSVKGPELINMYVGESEKNIRDVFQRARNARPCVIFFDELDSLAPNRGHGSDSGGVMDRVVSQLLAELDGLQKASSVFVIGATNRPDLLDPALLRPGRLDKLLYLGVCRSLKAQLPVLRALTRKFDLHADLELEHVAKECPLTFTGADFYALCTDALMGAMKERVSLVDAVSALVKAAEATADAAAIAKEKAKLSLVEAEPLLVEKRHFLSALPGITPSVSEKELARYEEIREKYS